VSEWVHSIVEIAGVAATVILYIAANKRQAKKEQNQRHIENTAKLDAILSEREYLPPHGHVETEGPLMAKGIVRRPNGRH
jgi:hypothetical protein